MIGNFFQKIRKSVLLKILLVILLTGFLVNLVLGWFFRFHTGESRRSFARAIHKYADFLIEELQQPPQEAIARKLAERFSLEIRYEGPNGSWSTNEKTPPIEKVHFPRFLSQHSLKIGWYRGVRFVRVEKDHGRFLFAFGQRYREISEEMAVLTALLVIALFIAAYLAMRRILAPVRLLAEGVSQISDGNLTHQIPVKRSDELGDLAESFNSMTGRIREMIKAKEQLLIDVSHELRSPVTRAKVALEFLEDEKTRKSIQEDVGELETMITEILEAEQLTSEHGGLSLQKTNLTLIAKELVSRFENNPPGVRFTSETRECFASVDPARIKTVLRNLIENGLKYSDSTERPLEISLISTEKRIQIRIEDRGEGIPEEELPFLFEPFYRVDKSRSKATGGYGLGLSLCKKIVEAHGGSIEVASKVGEGTVFTISFPKN